MDFTHDEFAGVFRDYFPKSVTFRPGDTIDFRQAWNGDPHSVTMGTLVDQGLATAEPLLAKYPNGQGAPPEVQQQLDELSKSLPPMVDNNGAVNQVAAQPCFLDAGTLPTDASKPCPTRTQPAFNGRQPFYSSGFIPYAGNQGNQFRVKLADDIKPGTYRFFCTYHGPGMAGTLHVAAKGTKLASQAEISRQARKEVDESAVPLLKAFRTATSGPFDINKAAHAAHFLPPQGSLPPGAAGMYLAGYGSKEVQDASVYEFLPRTIKAKVGEKVAWALIGAHTVSVGVPNYFPELTIARDGTVKIDNRGADAAGGPGFPDQLPDNPANPFVVDGGTWGGSGLHSSGLPNDTGGPRQVVAYSLTFTKAGTYNYACLIHPRMVGKVVVAP